MRDIFMSASSPVLSNYFGKNHLIDNDLSISWKSVRQCTKCIKARNRSREWKLPEQAITGLSTELSAHKKTASLHPIGLDIRLGKSIEHDFEEAVAFIADSLQEVGVGFRFEQLFKPRISLPYGKNRENKRGFYTKRLDFANYQVPGGSGVMFDSHRNSPSDKTWSGMEALWSLGINPQALIGLLQNDNCILLPGLIVESEHLLSLNLDAVRNIVHLSTIWSKTPLHSRVVAVASSY